MVSKIQQWHSKLPLRSHLFVQSSNFYEPASKQCPQHVAKSNWAEFGRRILPLGEGAPGANKHSNPPLFLGKNTSKQKTITQRWWQPLCWGTAGVALAWTVAYIPRTAPPTPGRGVSMAPRRCTWWLAALPPMTSTSSTSAAHRLSCYSNDSVRRVKV